MIYAEGISHLYNKIWSRRVLDAKASHGLASIASSFVIAQLYDALELPFRDSPNKMGASTRPSNSDGAYAPVDTPGDQPSPGGNAIAATNRARPHPAFVTDEGPTLFIDTLGSILTRRAPAVRMICYISAILLTTDFLTVGLSANASSNIGSTETGSSVDPAGILIITVAGFGEVTLFAVLSFCFLCNWHLAYFLGIALIGVSALGTGAYGLAIMAISMSNSVCANKGSCNEALKKGLAASCIGVLLTCDGPHSTSPHIRFLTSIVLHFA